MRWILLLLLAGCSANVPESADPELTRGRRVYLSKCSACHGLFSVERYSDDAWKTNVDKMLALKKVRLQDEERRRLVEYLTSVNGRD